MTSLIARQLRSSTVPRFACCCSWYFTRTIHLSADVLKDYYKILGVNKSSSQKDIKSAYFKLAKKYHPDANPGNAQAAEKFRDASAAYETLSNKQKKESYDTFGSTTNSSKGYGNPYANQQQWGFQSTQMNPKEAEEMFKKIMQELGAQGNAGFSQKSSGGIFGSIFSSMAQGFGRKMAEEMMKGTNSNPKSTFQKFEIKQTKNGFEIKKK